MNLIICFLLNILTKNTLNNENISNIGEFIEIREETIKLRNKDNEFQFKKCPKNVQLYFLLKIEEEMSKPFEYNYSDLIFLRSRTQKKKELAFYNTIREVTDSLDLTLEQKYRIRSIKFKGRQAHRQIFGMLEFFSSLFSFIGFVACIIGHLFVNKKETEIREQFGYKYKTLKNGMFGTFMKNLRSQSWINIISSLISAIYHTNPYLFPFVFADYMGVFAICWYSSWFNWWKMKMMLMKSNEIKSKVGCDDDSTEENRSNRSITNSFESQEDTLSRITNRFNDLRIVASGFLPDEPYHRQLFYRKSVILPYLIIFITQFFNLDKNFMKYADLILIIMSHYCEFSLPQIFKTQASRPVYQRMTHLASEIRSTLRFSTSETIYLDQTDIQPSLFTFLCDEKMICSHKKNYSEPCRLKSKFCRVFKLFEIFLALKVCTIVSCIFIEFIDFPPMNFLVDSHVVWHILLVFQTIFHYKIEMLEMDLVALLS